MVQIANPIYDAVFKYLMQDNKAAKLLLSAIIGREITALEFRPTERHIPLGEQLLVVRMDFNARIRDEQGNEEMVIMELQKAKLPTDIMRFRRYLGEQYMDKDNVIREPDTPYRKALPILSIYFLGHTLERVKAPVLWVNRTYVDMATGEQIQEREEFVESLTHDSIIIQIPYLKGKRRTELERLLALFDQSNRTADSHFLYINEKELPKRYYPLIRRLQNALVDPSVRQTMDDEDDFIEDIKDFQRQIANSKQVMREQEKALQEQEQAIQEQEKAIQEQEKTLQEQEKTIQEREKALQEREKALQERRQQLEGAIRKLFSAGTPASQIAVIFELSLAEVEAIVHQ